MWTSMFSKIQKNMQTSDHNVTETAYDAAKCKLSAVKLGYFKDDFISYFVDKPRRRIPLINRGYYLRNLAIWQCVDSFIQKARDTNSPIQILSLGAGFDTLYFRLLQSYKIPLSIIEVDCGSIANAKAQAIRENSIKISSHIEYGDIKEVSHVDSHASIVYECEVSELHSKYCLVDCDLGDHAMLEEIIHSAGFQHNIPTLILAECVVSYLEPTNGTKLFRWLGKAFSVADAIMYDPHNLNDDFGNTLKAYFQTKGCSLRSFQKYQTLQDLFERYVIDCSWQTCRFINMNEVYKHGTSKNEKRRVLELEIFDEYSDWIQCNAHYGIYLLCNYDEQIAWHQSWQSNVFANCSYISAYSYSVATTNLKSPLLVRTLMPEDDMSVRLLFKQTHLEYAAGSKSVKSFVNNRLTTGDMVHVSKSYIDNSRLNTILHNQPSCFWVAIYETQIIGCIGVKPKDGEPNMLAELCRLSVAAPFRRKRIGSMLIDAVEAYIIHHTKYTGIYLETIENMEPAHHLYKSKGYKQTQMQAFKGFSLLSFEKPIKR